VKRYDENPMYIQLYKRILKNIETKKYSYSEKLPSENQFAKEFGVNRHTIRQSLELLKNEGLIYTKIGVGNFISNIKVPYSISDKSSYTSKILDLGYEPKTELLNIDIIQSNEQIASNLGLKTGLKVIELKLLRYANDIPISVSYSYFDAYIYRELINNLKCNPFSLYKALDKAYPHLEITKQSTVFEAVMSTQQLSELLMMPLNSPILTASTISKDQNGNFVEYGISYFRGDTCKIKVDLV
jgi:DNA-binding GntR family transcriptional regulator